MSASSVNSSDVIPKNGWHKELQDAEEAAKEVPLNADSQLRVIHASLRMAIASRKLREWTKCKRAAQLGLSLEPNPTTRKELRECLNVAKEEIEKSKSATSMMNDDSYGGQLLERVAGGIVSINDGLLLAHPTYSNLNPLQFATLTGDVQFLEQLIAQGAAVDYPVLPNPPNHEKLKMPKAPRGSTALVLGTATLAVYAKIGPHPVMFPYGTGNIDNMVECCIRLVMVGADFNKKLVVPASSFSLPNQLFRQFHLDGMSVQELAVASGQAKLIDAIAKMDKDKTIVTQCRCGSRLSWNECHGFHDESRIYIESNDDSVVGYWRCSPVSRCPCQPMVGNRPIPVANKMYVDCCWNKTAYFLNDTTGEFLQATSDGSPLVYCAALYCDKIESKPEEFAFCSRCMLYPYCSKACQKTHWRLHKERCSPKKK